MVGFSMQWEGPGVKISLRTMGIVGLDYCGSTVVSNVLSSMPGVLNVGESHWIRDRELGCRECHRKPCPIFTRNMLEELRTSKLSKNSWWEIFSRHSGAELIVSTDKLPKHYDRFGVPDNLLLLHKDPKANIVSWCNRKFSDDLDEIDHVFSSKQIETGMGWWIEISSNIMDWIEKQDCDVSSMSLEQFSADPRGMTKSLCGWLGIEYDPSSIDFWNRELHYIGGNHSVKRMEPEKHFYRRITTDERWRKILKNEDAEMIENHPEINSILKAIEDVSAKGRSSFFRLP